MEANKIQGEAKSLTLPNGIEVTYCERGEEHDEVVVTGAFYFHTFMPVVEELAKRYHVYGVVMRLDGPTTEFEPDGSVNWARQWGSDIWGFCEAMGIDKFRYIGKCHGTVPGWYIVKEHPEALQAFASFYLAPHVLPQNSNKWLDMAKSGDVSAMMGAAMRKPKTGVPAKMAEIAALGVDLASQELPEEYAAGPEHVWDSIDDCREALLNLDIPVCYLFGSEDPVFADHMDSSIWAIKNTRHARTVLLNGERHLMEIDCPERVAQECIDFFESAKTDWFAEEPEGDAASAPTVDVANSTEPDPDLAGTWRCAFNGPMGRTELGLELQVDGTTLSGILNILGKDQRITAGSATQSGFEATVAVKIAFRKGEAIVRGTRSGDIIAGTIELPLGTVDFTGERA